MDGGREQDRPHDELFRALVTHPETAEALLRERLPGEVVAQVVEGPPELLDGSFIDEALRPSIADALFRWRTVQGTELFIYCLVEHKSWPDPRLPLQLLRYLTRVWERLALEDTAKLPPVHALVVYHGARAWTVPRSFWGVLEGQPELLRGVLDFSYTLLDVGRVEEATLSENTNLRAGLRSLKYGSRQHLDGDVLGRALEAIARDGEGSPGFLLEAVFTYVGRAFTAMMKEEIRRAIRRGAPRREHEMIGLAQREWFEDGRREGEARGAVRARADDLGLLLRKRFGELPVELAARVAGADLPTLSRWMDRVFDATSLADVFDDGVH